MKTRQLLAVAFAIGIAVTAHAHGALAAFWLGFLSLAVLAGTHAPMRGQLGIAPDTQDIAASLNLDEILNSAITSFRRTILPLQMFATTFRVEQLQGTDVVQVPYYPLQGAASKDFNGTYDFATGAGGKTDTRPVTINKRKYQPLAFTGHDLARLPFLNAQKLGEMKGEKLAFDVIQDILSVVTAARYPQSLTKSIATIDSDFIVDLRTACNKNATGPLTVADGATTNTSTTITSATASFHSSDIGVAISGTGITGGTTIASVTNATTAVLSAAATATGTGVTFTLSRPLTPWPEIGRGLMVNPDVDGALLKDTAFKAAYAYGTDSAIKEGRLQRVFGFDYAQSAAIPSNGENLIGMAAFQSAILAAFSPIPPPAAVAKLLTRYEIADLGGMAIEYREWGTPGTDTENRVIECNYGFGPGESNALKRIKSA